MTQDFNTLISPGQTYMTTKDVLVENHSNTNSLWKNIHGQTFLP